MILSDLITPHVQKIPDQTAFIFRDTELSWKALDAQVNACAAGLSALGVKKGSTFGLLLRNCPEFVVLSLALSKLGGVSVPINFLEKPERVSLILNDAKAIGVLTAKEFNKTIQEARKTIPTLKHIVLREGKEEGTQTFEEMCKPNAPIPAAAVTENDLMTLLYTSGTTGQPKGVMLSHKNFLSNAEQCMRGIELSPHDKFLCLLPMFHSFSWTTCVLLPLKLGALTVIIESLLPFDPVIKAIWKYKVTTFVAVPQIFSALASKIKGPKAFFIRLLNPVRIAISGAAPLPTQVHTNFEQNIGVKLVEGYGLTEASPVVSLNPTKKRKLGTVGIALPGVNVEIRDDNGVLVPRDTVGEIWVKGDNVMQGYYGKPTETAEVLTADGWLKTGDMAKIDDEGYIAIVDRKKDLIIVKGLNVYPQEVENVIATIDSVKEVAVIGKPDPETGEELIRAFVVAKEGQEINKAEVFSVCRDQLAPYKRPREVIVLPELPKNALQKVLKKDLRKL